MALKGKTPPKKSVLRKPPINLNKKYKDIGNDPDKKKSTLKSRNA